MHCKMLGENPCLMWLIGSISSFMNLACHSLYVMVLYLGKTQRKAVRMGKKDGLCWRNHEI